MPAVIKVFLASNRNRLLADVCAKVSDESFYSSRHYNCWSTSSVKPLPLDTNYGLQSSSELFLNKEGIVYFLRKGSNDALVNWNCRVYAKTFPLVKWFKAVGWLDEVLPSFQLLVEIFLIPSLSNEMGFVSSRMLETVVSVDDLIF